MEQERNRRALVKCKKCVFCSQHSSGQVLFCLILSAILQDSVRCNGKLFVPLGDGDKYEQQLKAYRDTHK